MMITLTVERVNLDMVLSCEMMKNYVALQKSIQCLVGHHLNFQRAHSRNHFRGNLQ